MLLKVTVEKKNFSEVLSFIYDSMPIMVKKNVALRERICQKIGSERVKQSTNWISTSVA